MSILDHSMIHELAVQALQELQLKHKIRAIELVIELGRKLQELFDSLPLDKLQKAVKTNIEGKHKKIPSTVATLYSYLSEARIICHQEVVEEGGLEENIHMVALSKGLGCLFYAAGFSQDSIDNAFNKMSNRITAEEDRQIRKFQSLIPVTLKLNRTARTLREQCHNCKQHLAKVVNTKAKEIGLENPEQYLACQVDYYVGNSESNVQQQEIPIETNDGLTTAITSYRAIAKLESALTQRYAAPKQAASAESKADMLQSSVGREILTPSLQLLRFKSTFESCDVQHALAYNSDHMVKGFFDKVKQTLQSLKHWLQKFVLKFSSKRQNQHLIDTAEKYNEHVEKHVSDIHIGPVKQPITQEQALSKATTEVSGEQMDMALLDPHNVLAANSSKL